MKTILATLVAMSVLAVPASAARAPVPFTLFGCECSPPTVVLGWRGATPGTTLVVYRDGLTVHRGANPQGAPFNVYLPSQPRGLHRYKACTGNTGPSGFVAAACSQVLHLTVR